MTEVKEPTVLRITCEEHGQALAVALFGGPICCSKCQQKFREYPMVWNKIDKEFSGR